MLFYRIRFVTSILIGRLDCQTRVTLIAHTTEYMIVSPNTSYKVQNTNISLQIKLIFRNIILKCMYQVSKKLMFVDVLA